MWFYATSQQLSSSWFGLVLVLDDKNKESWKDGDDDVGR